MDKKSKNTEISTFVRLGDGYAAGSEAHYSPVKIDPYFITLPLKEGEYMIIVNEDGSVKMIGKPLEKSKPTFDVEKDMQ